MSKDIAVKIGKNIAAARKVQERTQADVAEAVPVLSRNFKTAETMKNH
ncbi:hypothetical protein PQR62_09815 [Herbaspirillum lusitanum]|uniref:Uncharacterized protein n=1 Tax=Herbaspirillum lusitanum TaxID=213312 RepID=A0ABW9A775_9BURK